MLKASKSVKTLEIQGARTYFVILFSGEMVNHESITPIMLLRFKVLNFSKCFLKMLNMIPKYRAKINCIIAFQARFNICKKLAYYKTL